MEVALRSPSRVQLPLLPPLALYVHIPWCVRKCPYCDFNSHEKKDALPEQRYVDRLVQDFESLLPSVWGRRISSVFIGGGTPSLFSPEAIDALLAAVRARLPVEPHAEITLEANPGTAEASRFAGYRQAGVNRLSIGVQSFDDAMLGKLGRIHSADEARRAIDMAKAVFDNVNLDVMYGLPGQTAAMLEADIEAALFHGTTHLSFYQLTIEPNTVFFSKPPVLPEHDLSADMQLRVEQKLSQNGYEHYETSAFARPEARCRHNLNYWEFGDYVGIGAGAHGKVSFPDRITRHEQVKQPREYLSGVSRNEKNILPADLPFEFMLNALRLVEGFDIALFERTGLPWSTVERPLQKALSDGLIEADWKRVRPTERGRHFLNDLLGLFLHGGSKDRG